MQEKGNFYGEGESVLVVFEFILAMHQLTEVGDFFAEFRVNVHNNRNYWGYIALRLVNNKCLSSSLLCSLQSTQRTNTALTLS